MGCKNSTITARMSTIFSHLHTHSHFSLLNGIPEPEELVVKAKQLGYTSIALTDTNTISGLILFRKACQKHNIKGILGVHLQNEHNPQNQITLLAKNLNGYSDLCQLTTSYLCHHRQNTAFCLSQLFQNFNPSNIFILSPDQSTLQNIIPNIINTQNLYAEIVSQCSLSRKISRTVVAFAKQKGIELVASNPCYFLQPQDYSLHKVVKAIAFNSSLEQLNPHDIAPRGAYLKSPLQIQKIFSRQPQALTNTQVIIQQVHYPPLPKTIQWIMPKLQNTNGESSSVKLKRYAMEGLKQNYPLTSQATSTQKANFKKALTIQTKELDVIARKGYCSYFLMVKQIRDWANQTLQKGYRKPTDLSLIHI